MKVLFLDEVHEILAQRLKAHAFECIDGTDWDREKCLANIADFDGIVIRSRIKIDEEMLSAAKALQFIARSGAGMENIDEDFATKRNITCFNAPEGNRNAVAEHALGMILSLFNKLCQADAEVRKGIWRREANRGIELDGKTVGIIGYGNNGSAFAKKLRGFDVEILAYDKYKSGFGNDFIKECEMSEIFEKADVVSFHIPQNEETIYLGNRSFFESFRNKFYVINLSRGKIIQTASLVDAIKNGKVLGACLDVLEYESSSFENIFNDSNSADLDYLLHSDKVIFSPHVGGWTKESYFKLSNVLADKILAAFA
jgi:D-3-phosphoglycerate dehydrogenase